MHTDKDKSVSIANLDVNHANERENQGFRARPEASLYPYILIPNLSNPHYSSAGRSRISPCSVCRDLISP